MKIIFALIFACLALSNAQAATCTSELRNRNHIRISSFSGYGSSTYEACLDSREQCNEELAWRLRTGNYPGAYCIDLSSAPDPVYYFCYSNLRLANGAYVASYRGRSQYSQQEACSNALRTCYTDLRRRQNSSRYYNAYCEIDQHRRPVPTPIPTPTPMPTPPPGTDVTRTCEAALLSDSGQVLQVFSASVTGDRNDRTIGREACDQAMKKCMAMRSGSESCRLH